MFKNKKNKINPYVEQITALKSQVMTLQKAITLIGAEVAYLSEQQRGINPSAATILNVSEDIEEMLRLNGGK